jgi:hypothetical protein
MQNLIIKATPKSFEVNCQSGFIEIKGCSIVNDPKVFFKPVQNWINAYLKNPPESTVIDLKIEYIDSASTKNILEILQLLEKIKINNKSVLLNWYYDDNDPEILEIGEILSGRSKIPFKFIQY